MYRKYRSGLIAAGAIAATVVCLDGCGGGGGALPSADVLIRAIITTAANSITSVTVTTQEAGDQVTVAGATAQIDRADGTTAPVTLTATGGGTQLTLGTATVTPSATQFNTLTINGPIRFTDGATGTTTIIGLIEFKFEVLPDGTVVHPTGLTVAIPTQGAAKERRVIFTGLSAAPPDYVKTTIVDAHGGITKSSTHAADAQGRVILKDAQGNITASVLSGNSSKITLFFARTDADDNGVPDLFE